MQVAIYVPEKVELADKRRKLAVQRPMSTKNIAKRSVNRLTSPPIVTVDLSSTAKLKSEKF